MTLNGGVRTRPRDFTLGHKGVGDASKFPYGISYEQEKHHSVVIREMCVL